MKSDLLGPIKAAYDDGGLVSAKLAQVKGSTVEYLEGGEGETVVFLHGAAFDMETWRYVKILDVLASRGYRVLSLNLPGYGATSANLSRETFLTDVVDALVGQRKVVVVVASMGGTYGLPFAESDDRIAGYVSTAGLLSTRRDPRRLKHLKTLFVYGDQDPRLKNDEKQRELFTNSRLVVFKNAPHACYLRDLDATTEFNTIVLAFVDSIYNK